MMRSISKRVEPMLAGVHVGKYQNASGAGWASLPTQPFHSNMCATSGGNLCQGIGQQATVCAVSEPTPHPDHQLGCAVRPSCGIVSAAVAAAWTSPARRQTLTVDDALFDVLHLLSPSVKLSLHEFGALPNR